MDLGVTGYFLFLAGFTQVDDLLDVMSHARPEVSALYKADSCLL